MKRHYYLLITLELPKSNGFQELLKSMKVLEMDVEPIFVQLFGPYKFDKNADENVFNNKWSEKKGVYLLTIPFGTKFLVYYVGETGVSFSKRILQHVQNYLSGFYRIFDPEEFSKGKKVLLWGGMWKSNRKDPQNIFEFMENQSRLVPKAVRFIEQLQIFLAPINANKRIIERIESTIARTINEQEGIVGNFQDKDVRYRARKSNEQEIKLVLDYPKLILGLKKELSV